jgi:hypothetical protein
MSGEPPPPQAARDWTHGPRGLVLWGSLMPVRYLVVLWPVVLTFMGVACLLNARGCGRLHCYFTGPFFLVMAGVALLYGLDVLPLGPRGWNLLGLILLAGGIALTCGPELILGRYRQTKR